MEYESHKVGKISEKIGLKGCKWSSLKAPGAETHVSDSAFSFIILNSSIFIIGSSRRYSPFAFDTLPPFSHGLSFGTLLYISQNLLFPNLTSVTQKNILDRHAMALVRNASRIR